MRSVIQDGAKSIFNSLLRNKVKTAFMYGGGAIMPLTDQFQGAIRAIVNNHEQNCGHAATGYAKSSGQPGVVIVTSGPGLTNMITPMMDANKDGVPLVVFSGQVSLDAMGTDAFQECPAVGLSTHCTKWSYCAEKGDDLFELSNEAFRVAMKDRKGAVHIDLPRCLLVGPNGHSAKRFTDPRAPSQTADYEHLRTLIANSLSPVLCVGQGANAYPRELAEFVERFDLHTTSTIHAMGTYNERGRLSLGFMGMHGAPVANHAIQNADLIIALGSRFDDRTTGQIDGYAPKCAHIIHVNIEKAELGKVIDTSPSRLVHKLHMDCGVFLANMNRQRVVTTPRTIFGNKIEAWKTLHPLTYNTPANDALNTQMVIEQINRSIEHDNTIIASGVGNHQMMAAQFITWTQPNQFITSGSLGVMGVGLPYAIGAQLANPDKVVVLIDGDGSFNHTLADLQTMAKHKLPVKIFIMNDGHLSMVRVWEKLFYSGHHVTTSCSHNPDYNLLAASYGIRSIRITNRSELQSMVEYAIRYDQGPILCNVMVESDICLPMVKPGRPLDDMMTIQRYRGNIPSFC